MHSSRRHFLNPLGTMAQLYHWLWSRVEFHKEPVLKEVTVYFKKIQNNNFKMNVFFGNHIHLYSLFRLYLIPTASLQLTLWHTNLFSSWFHDVIVTIIIIIIIKEKERLEWVLHYFGACGSNRKYKRKTDTLKQAHSDASTALTCLLQRNQWNPTFTENSFK